MNESQYIRMSHGTYECIMSHTNESCHIGMHHVIYEWVMAHPWDVRNESWHLWMSHGTHKAAMARMHTSCHTYEWVMSHFQWEGLSDDADEGPRIGGVFSKVCKVLDYFSQQDQHNLKKKNRQETELKSWVEPSCRTQGSCKRARTQKSSRALLSHTRDLAFWRVLRLSRGGSAYWWDIFKSLLATRCLFAKKALHNTDSFLAWSLFAKEPYSFCKRALLFLQKSPTQ